MVMLVVAINSQIKFSEDQISAILDLRRLLLDLPPVPT
jgi:hypothetical protein